MIFRYKRVQGVLRPVIPIKIHYRNRSVIYEVLVDSGADVCMFDSEIGDTLGIPFFNGRSGEVVGVTGVVKPYYIHPVTITVGNQSFDTEAGFLSNVSRFGYGVVGQRGFFEHFVVSFDFLKGEISVMERT
ncbi:hypothetical protein HY630_02420 [Candidatus Uhrbacteria bacterium]|nr:hypothetical protein [Candidatus Uhrbacteria bacterium]